MELACRIRALKHIRSSLTADMAKTVACALVNSRLDYANSVMCGTSTANTTKLQGVQNTFTRVVTNTRCAEHIHPVLAICTGFQSSIVLTTRWRLLPTRSGPLVVQPTFCLL